MRETSSIVIAQSTKPELDYIRRALKKALTDKGFDRTSVKSIMDTIMWVTNPFDIQKYITPVTGESVLVIGKDFPGYGSGFGFARKSKIHSHGCICIGFSNQEMYAPKVFLRSFNKTLDGARRLSFFIIEKIEAE